MPRKKPPELTFQQHLADFFVREHGYGVLEQEEITDTEHCIAEDHLWAFLQDTQSETLKKLADDYGKDTRDEVFRALRAELQRQTPLWLLLRHGLKVRGLEFRLYYPQATLQRKHCQQTVRQEPHHLSPTLLFWRHESGD